MLGVIVSAYKEFESRVKLLTDPNISKADRIREMIKIILAPLQNQSF